MKKKLLVFLLLICIAMQNFAVAAVYAAESDSVSEKYPYDVVLPKIKEDLSAAEKNMVDEAVRLFFENVKECARKINDYEDDLFEISVKEILDILYEDENNIDRKKISDFTGELDERADLIVSGYDRALKERLNSEQLDYEVGRIIIQFEEEVQYGEVKEITDHVGKEIKNIDSTGRTIEQCIKDGAQHRKGWPIMVSIDVGYRETTEAVGDKISLIQGVKDVSLNGIYYLEDPIKIEILPETDKDDDTEEEEPTEQPATKEDNEELTEEEKRNRDDQAAAERENGLANAGSLVTEPEEERSIAQVQKDAEAKALAQERELLKTGKSRYTVKKGKTIRIKAYSSSQKKVTFRSNASKIARVNSKGKVKGLKKGKAKITVRCGSVKRTVFVTVK